MENAIAKHFHPDTIFNRLDTYIKQVFLLDNIQISSFRKFPSQTLGLISISEKLGQKDLKITKDDLILYDAKKTVDWVIIENRLSNQQIIAIESLPQTKEQILIEFFGRKLTHKLKRVFQLRNYPINQAISLNHAQVPYKFIISEESTSSEIVFIGISDEGNSIFKSSFDRKSQPKVIENHLSLEHINQLCSFDP